MVLPKHPPESPKEKFSSESSFLASLDGDEAEVPVPDRLHRKSKQKQLVSQLKLSQMIGILLWLNREDMISSGGKTRLLYLQKRASFEAIEAGLKFASRLQSEFKLTLDFKPHANELNRMPQSRRYRKLEPRRIGVGYRDKGTLPDPSSAARRKTTEESFILLADLPELLQQFIHQHLPESLEEDWVDLEEVQGFLNRFLEIQETQLLS